MLLWGGTQNVVPADCFLPPRSPPGGGCGRDMVVVLSSVKNYSFLPPTPMGKQTEQQRGSKRRRRKRRGKRGGSVIF